MINIFSYDFSYKHIVVILLLILGLAAFSYSIYSIYSYLNRYGIISKYAKETYTRLCDINKNREKQNAVTLIEKGNEKDKSILAIVDRMITYSGINRKIKWVNTEVALSINIICTVVVTSATSIATKSIINGVIAATILELAVVIVIIIQCNRNYIRVEESLGQFMGCVENFSSSSNDLIEILDKVEKYVDPVISREIDRCVTEANNSGNATASLIRLENTFENSYWKLIIRNLAICSRYSCNYTDAIKQLKEIVEEYISYERQKREEYRNNRVMIMILLAVGLFAMNYVAVITDTTLGYMLLSNRIMLLITIIALAVVIYISIIKGMIH